MNFLFFFTVCANACLFVIVRYCHVSQIARNFVSSRIASLLGLWSFKQVF